MVDESPGLNSSSGRLDQKKEGKYFMNKWMDKDPSDPLNMCQFVYFQSYVCIEVKPIMSLFKV